MRAIGTKYHIGLKVKQHGDPDALCVKDKVYDLLSDSLNVYFDLEFVKEELFPYEIDEDDV